MRSIHIRSGIGAAMAAALALALASCGGTASPASGGASAGSSALIHIASMKVGDKTQTVLKNAKGLTLYYFTPDTATAIACSGGCASTWPPLLATSGSPSSSPALPDQLAAVDKVTLFDADRQQVAVESFQAGIVLDDQVVSVADQVSSGIGHRSRQHHDPVRRREHRRSQRHREVDPGMEVGKARVSGLKDVGRRAEALGDGRVWDRPEQVPGGGQHRVFRDQLGRNLGILLGE